MTKVSNDFNKTQGMYRSMGPQALTSEKKILKICLILNPVQHTITFFTNGAII